MTTKTSILFFLIFYIQSTISFSQSNNLTNSPYSLFGLGRINETNSGKTNALGKSGIALDNQTEINNLNPAAFATIKKHSFFFDLGTKFENLTYENNNDKEKRPAFGFTNINVAFAISEKSGIGLSLSPYSDVGYFLTGVETNVEGTQNVFYSTITGNGGLSNIVLNYGRKLNSRINVGLNTTYYFGKINETELIYYETDLLSIKQTSRYKGVRFGLGFQYRKNEKVTFASVVHFPTSLFAKKDREVFKIVNESTSIAENSVGNKIDPFYLPFEVQVGLKYKFFPSITLNTDYKKTFWKATEMVDNIGEFVNQDFIGVGFEYANSKPKYKLTDRIKLRIGANFDNGYLQVNEKRITNSAFTSGIAIPVSSRNNSFLNISYSYGQRGLISETLIKENYHLFTLNFSLEDLWFVQRKID